VGTSDHVTTSKHAKILWHSYAVVVEMFWDGHLKDTNDTRIRHRRNRSRSRNPCMIPKIRKIKSDIHLWELNGLTKSRITAKIKQVFVYETPNEALDQAHAIAVLTEWDEFKTYEWEAIYDKMYKPAFIFDGRNILDVEKLQKIGFEIKGIGKG
jgi:UDPglucose 6-dehydrogenase